MNKLKRAVTLLLALCLSAAVCGCRVKLGYGVVIREDPVVKTKIAQVSDLDMNNQCVLSFGSVSGAEKYRINVNDFTFDTAFVAVDLKSTDGFALPTDGKFTVTVVTVPKYIEEYEESDPLTKTFTVAGETLYIPEIRLVRPNVIRIECDSRSYGVALKINGFLFEQADLTGNEFDLTSIGANEYDISLQSTGDNVYLHDSPTVRLLYSYNAAAFRLPKVENARMNGLTLTFDAIDNAYSYVLVDVLNNQFEARTNAVDLSDKMMIRAVYARSLAADVEPGEPQTEIRYFNGGEGTALKPYEIDSWQSLRYIEYFERQDIKKNYKLTADIDFPDITMEDIEQGSNYMEIGSLSGILDGDGHTIRNVTTNSTRGFVGLFETVGASAAVKNITFEKLRLRTWRELNGDGNVHPMGGSIGVVCKQNFGILENIRLTDCELDADEDAVSLVSVNGGTIRNAAVTGNTIHSGAEGGLIATVNNGTIENCVIEENSYTVTKNAAGVCALNYGVIVGCKNSMRLSYTDKNEVGGIVSWNEGTVKNCENSAAIAANNYAGGIVGKNGGSIIGCTNSGTISGANFAGGITGNTERLGESAVIGYQSRIYGCDNAGAVTATKYAGGIAGNNRNGFIELCYNEGTVTGGTAGGITAACGVNGGETAWTNAGVYSCFNRGAVSGKIAGGIAGINAAWRYDTANSPFVKVEGNGVYNCVSLGVKLIGKNENQVCDSWSDLGLSEGTFLLGSTAAKLTDAKVPLSSIDTQSFADKLNACAGCVGRWTIDAGKLKLVRNASI